MEETMVCEEIIVRLPTSAYKRSHKRRKRSASTARPVSTCGGKRHGRRVLSQRHENVMKVGKYSPQKMRIDRAQDRNSLALRRSSRLSQRKGDRECLPQCAPDIDPRDISEGIECHSTEYRAGAADDKVVCIMNSPHYQSDECKAGAEVLALERQKRDDMPQSKIIPRLGEVEEGSLKCDQGSISPTHHNEHAPEDTILSPTTTKATSLPGIEFFEPDRFRSEKRTHDVQGCLSGIGLRDLHELSLQPWFIYGTARRKEMQAQMLSVT